MSLKETAHTKHYNSIPKKCKQCCKAIFTVEDNIVHYQCSLFGVFKRNCTIETEQRILKKPEEINSKFNKEQE